MADCIQKHADNFVYCLLKFVFHNLVFLLIKERDNPFDYNVHRESGTEISLKPIHDLEIALNDFMQK